MREGSYLIIWKFELHILQTTNEHGFIIDRSIKVEVPTDAQLLHLETVNHSLYMWVRCNPDNEKVIRKFDVLATGENITKDLGPFLTTVMMEPDVWHIFEEL